MLPTIVYAHLKCHAFCGRRVTGKWTASSHETQFVQVCWNSDIMWLCWTMNFHIGKFIVLPSHHLIQLVLPPSTNSIFPQMKNGVPPGMENSIPHPASMNGVLPPVKNGVPHPSSTNGSLPLLKNASLPLGTAPSLDDEHHLPSQRTVPHPTLMNGILPHWKNGVPHPSLVKGSLECPPPSRQMASSLSWRTASSLPCQQTTPSNGSLVMNGDMECNHTLLKMRIFSIFTNKSL